MIIGVLDIQGSVEEHFAALKRAGISAALVKTVMDLEKVDALILPGGESTTIGKLLRKFGLREKIIERVHAGMPVYGTCAGAILLAKNIAGEQKADTLGLMDITIERNAYGRQLDSFETEIKFAGKNIPAVFIRAPKIVKVGKGVEILARYGKEIVAARQENMLVTTFHPEMTEDNTLYYYLLHLL